MSKNKLRRSSTSKSMFGVCGGLAEFFGISPFSVRLIFLFTMPGSFLVYIILLNSIDDSTPSL
ncbi:PspC domain-containing protein [Evansella sp. AB-rgal1]|uniref:PspC domain-containing protein n=1 Tax=Evansella sp. AB-rgal1 TaxID=3242696 RepID=UPI00359D481C